MKKMLALGGLCFTLIACSADRDSRGSWKKSADGKTYLVVEDKDGSMKGKFCSVDGQVWPWAMGEKGEIKPGTHEIECAAKVSFAIQPGVEYHLDNLKP